MNKLMNSVAVVTGAGSGIGRQLAIQLAQSGASLALSDINQNGLEETAQLLNEFKQRILIHNLDVSKRQAVFEYAELVQAEFNEVNLVINNAGVALSSGTFNETSIEDFEWLMSINFSGVLYGSKAFMPLLERAEWGHIVNISSLFGLIGFSEQSAYNASKFAVRGMTESLRQELERDNSHISCTSVHPGGIKTKIAANARVSKELDEMNTKLKNNFEQIAMTTAQSAAQQIIEAALKNKRRLILGRDAKLLDFVQRLAPNHYQKVMNYFVERSFKAT